MSGYYCRDCNAIKPLFDLSRRRRAWNPCLGTVPFDPELARHCDRGIPLADLPDTPLAGPWIILRSNFWIALTTSDFGAADEIPLRPCDTPMKLQTVGPPEGGSLSVVYSVLSAATRWRC